MHFMDEPKGNPDVDRSQCLSAANVSLGLMFYGMFEFVRLSMLPLCTIERKKEIYLYNIYIYIYISHFVVSANVVKQ